MKIEEEIDGRFRSEYHRGFINIIYTANQLHYRFVCELKLKNLTSQQYNVLKILRGFGPEAVSIEFIRKRMLDSHSDISRIVEKLNAKGLLDRRESQTDRRQKDVFITDKGRELLKQLDESEKKVDEYLKMLSVDEVNFLNNILDRIRD